MHACRRCLVAAALSTAAALPLAFVKLQAETRRKFRFSQSSNIQLKPVSGSVCRRGRVLALASAAKVTRSDAGTPAHQCMPAAWGRHCRQAVPLSLHGMRLNLVIFGAAAQGYAGRPVCYQRVRQAGSAAAAAAAAATAGGRAWWALHGRCQPRCSRLVVLGGRRLLPAPELGCREPQSWPGSPRAAGQAAPPSCGLAECEWSARGGSREGLELHDAVSKCQARCGLTVAPPSFVPLISNIWAQLGSTQGYVSQGQSSGAMFGRPDAYNLFEPASPEVRGRPNARESEPSHRRGSWHLCRPTAAAASPPSARTPRGTRGARPPSAP